MSFSPKSALERMQDTYQTTTVQFEEIARGAQVPEAVRALAEKGIAQIRENYERSKDAFDAVVESWERSFGASRQGAAALSRKVIDITQRPGRRALLRLWSYKQIIGASSLRRLGTKPRR